MRKIALSLVVFGALAALVMPQASLAQNARSWVASNGVDGNPCTLAQPCASFHRAIAQTNDGGEINCVDQGEFGNGLNLVISKSLTIDCEGVQGRISITTGIDAIDVTGPSDSVVVTLRGLDISGNGVGSNGIFFDTGAALHVEKCVIHGFAAGLTGWGIAMSPADTMTTLELFVSDTVVTNNGTSSSGGGILIRPVLTNIVKVVMNRIEVRNNFFGIKADATSASGGVINMTVRDSVSSGNASNGIVGTGHAGGPAIVMMVDRSASSHNAVGFGVIADGPLTTIRLGGSSVAGNSNGVGATNGGALQSYGTNQINGNSNDGIASLTPIGLH
ncbi:MAG: hypothetical protein JO273_25245 [Methylobacteriaceae bacterium]|nr:hypothetical protein [Methylobacteriaceae bacterium]